MKDNNRCTNPRLGRLIAAYELGLLGETERKAFVNHLVECLHCHNELYTMAPVMDVLRTQRQMALDRRRRWSAAAGAGTKPPIWGRRAFLTAASILLVVGLVVTVLFLRDSGRPPSTSPEMAHAPLSWESLAVPKADYVPPRSDRAPFRSGDAAALFERAIANYQNGDYATAAQQFEGVVQLQPDNAAAYFYRGVALLLAERAAEAVAPLEKAVELEAGYTRSRARYYLALAYLKTHQVDRARAQLEAILQSVCPYRTDAEKLLQQLRQQ
ncbi:MAG TPA: tetratricopeptide repeat protein [Blastocatellia bacterium]|nr:tetratricopeptide repeat protein [Blastocatellia bacterium]